MPASASAGTSLSRKRNAKDSTGIPGAAARAQGRHPKHEQDGPRQDERGLVGAPRGARQERQQGRGGARRREAPVGAEAADEEDDGDLQRQDERGERRRWEEERHAA